ncbi:chlorohydrolase [Streptococcus pneumoniae]|nr:chlorohydrolase [Streptococcus pneumoniae]
MKIKEQTRKLAAGCSKHCFEVVDRAGEVSSKHRFEVVDETDEVSNHTYGKADADVAFRDFRRVLALIFRAFT